MQYLRYIFLAVLLFLILRFIPKISKKILKKQRLKNRFLKFFPVIEFLIWAAFLFRTVNQLLGDKFYFTTLIYGIVIVILIFIGFYVLRDFAAGLLLKTEYNLSTGANMSIDDVSGKILKLSYLSLELEREDLERIKIPYSKINGKNITILNSEESVQKFDFDIKMSKTATDILSVKEQVRKQILNSAWSSILKNPDIKLDSEDADFWYFKVYFFAQNDIHAERVKSLFRA